MARERRHWPPQEVGLIARGLDDLAAGVQNSSERSIEEQIWLTRFLIVRTCGYLEVATHEMVNEHILVKSGGTVQSFALSWLERSRTPSPDNLGTLLGRLDGNLRNDFDDFLAANDKYLLDHLYALVARRHLVAHGRNEGVNSQKALEWVKVAKEIADWFELHLDPYPATKALS